MKIIRRCDNSVKFKDLKVGDAFYDTASDERDYLMMKTDVADDIQFERDNCPNAVDISDGLMYKYRCDDEVIKVEAEVVIE